MFFNEEESEWQKTKTSENFNKKMLYKKRQFSSDFYDQEVIKDFTRFTDIININTFGSQPIVMFKKIKRIQSPIEPTKKIYSKEKKTSATSREKNQKKNLKNNYNYISGGGLGQKINKYKSKTANHHHSQSPSTKINNNIKSKTNRDKEKDAKRVKTQQTKMKTKEYIPKTAKENYFNYKQIFKKEKKGQKTNNQKTEVNKANFNENNKYMTDKNTIEQNEKRKNENINNLIKNAVQNFKKEYLAKKMKNNQDKKTEKKIKLYEDYENQIENGIVLLDKSEDLSHFKIKKIKPLKKKKIKKINTNNINNINYNYHTDNDKFILNNLTSSNNYTKSNEFSKILIKSKIISNNNFNNENMGNKNLISENKKKNILNPQINQFEFLEKIRNNYKRIKKIKNEQKNSPELLNDSFRFSNSNKYKIKNNQEYIPYNKYDENKIYDKEYALNEEFLYADRVTHRTHRELDNFLKRKKSEMKKEQKEIIKKKQEKIMNTLQNLIRLGEQYKNNNSPQKTQKNRIDSKNHIKPRRIANEYYVGTEESKNNTSTFIDKQEFYKSILESKNVLINSKVEKTELNTGDIKIDINNKNNAKNIMISNSMSNYENKIKLDTFMEKYNKKTDINKEYNNMQDNHFKDEKLEDLKERISNTIKRSNEIFNKENLKRFKSDLSDITNNNLIKFESQYFIKNINNNINNKSNINKRNNNLHQEIKNQIINFQKKISLFLKRIFWKNMKEKYNKEKANKIKTNKKIAFDFLIGICKVYQFKKIQEYNQKMKWANAIIKLFSPFIRNKFMSFIQKCKYINKLKYFVYKLNIFLKYNILQKLLKYSINIEFLKKIILSAIKPLKKLFLKKYFIKIKNLNKNIITDLKKNIANTNNRSYLSNHCVKDDFKSNSYIYESLDCEDSISVHPNSVDNDGLHQLKEIIEMQNENRLEDNIESSISEGSLLQYMDPLKKGNSNINGSNIDSFLLLKSGEIDENMEKAKKKENTIKNEIHLKEHLLQQIINNNQTSTEEIKNTSNNEINEEQKKEEKENLIITKINEEKEKSGNINNQSNIINKNIILINKDKQKKNSDNEDIINIIENNDNDDINLQNLNEVVSKIKDKNKFADELTNYIISNVLIEKEIKSKVRLFPQKSGDFNFKKYNDINLQSLLNNNKNTESNNTLDSLINLSLSDYTQNDSQILEKSMILQYSLSSEFNKTLKERKNILETNLYNNYIIDKLILLICKEIKQNYSRIYDNISIPYKSNYEKVIIASNLQDNELLNNSYKELNVKEDLKNIINKNKIIEKFNSINKKIRKLKGLEENNSYDNLINECIIDATIEIINKERPYGELGEPFPFSKREREIYFKYNRNDPKPLMKHVYKSLKKMLFGKGNIIKENSPIFDKNDPFLMNIFKKEMENENIWNELEIQEEQVKSLASNIIFDQLINEVIEILEHVQMNRKKPELYQNKSIYGCDEIPRLSFQMISSNNENDEAERDLVSN